VDLSRSTYSRAVAGVYATKPGILLGLEDEVDPSHTIPMGMLGVIPTKVSGENGSIAVGDLVVSSGTPGHAMKADLTDPGRLIGAVIGKAVEPFTGPGTGKINVLVNVK
jgi:hypothetical protein